MHNEELSQRTVMLIVNSTKMTGRVLTGAIRTWLYYHRRLYPSKGQSRTAGDDGKMCSGGRKTLKEMEADGDELVNIQITDGNIRSFEKVARKYNISYSLKRDKSRDPPRYFVFFKARDTDILEAAFKEYAGLSIKKEKKVSVMKKLEKAAEKVASRQKERVRTRERNREQSR